MFELNTSETGDSASASSASMVIYKIAPISITVDHPRLLETDGESICVLLRKYYQYANMVKNHARQQVSATSTTEPVRPVDFKSCVDVDFLESMIALGFIAEVNSYDELTDTKLCVFLEERAKKANDVVTIDMLDKIVQSAVRTNMKNSNAKACMQELFSFYHTNGLGWNVKGNKKWLWRISFLQSTHTR